MSLFLDPVFWVEWPMLSALLGIGLYVSYTDLTVRRVPNRCTFALLAVGLLGQGLMIAFEVTTLGRVGEVVFTSLVLALVLTWLGLWAPGDAKLFWAAVVALPPTLCPSLGFFSLHSTALALFINALWCYLMVLLVISFSGRDWKQVDTQGRPNIGEFGLAGLILAALLGWVLWVPALVLGRPLSYLEVLGTIVIGYRLLEWRLVVKYWPIIVWPGIVSLCYLVWITEGKWTYFLLWGLTWLVELGYLRLRHWYRRGFVQAFPISELQPGAMLRDTLRVPNEESGDEQVYESGTPLSGKQVYRLQTLARAGHLPGGDTLELEQPLPFVPFIVGGAVLTALFAGNIVLPLIRLIGWLGG